MADSKDKKAGDTYRQTDVMHVAKNRGISMDDARDLIEGSRREKREDRSDGSRKHFERGRGTIA